ncbi:cyanobacterial phytochrome B [Acrasis kona]|uniref:Cyanobacterial phytochrome B n=1 Tax=Acrasis kona TaxID=1008807 RepID=A0AAW2ZFD1_9EUKA
MCDEESYQEACFEEGDTQSYGIVLVLMGTSFSIVNVSENVTAFFNCGSDELLYTRLEDVVNADEFQYFKDKVAEDCDNVVDCTFTISINNEAHTFEGSAYEVDDLMFLELILNNLDLPSSPRGTKSYLEDIEHKDIKALAKDAAQEAQTITGFDNVKVYQIINERELEVIAEVDAHSTAEAEGTVCHISDALLQDTDLYLMNWIHLIADVNDKPSMITPNYHVVTREQLDTRKNLLRTVPSTRLHHLKQKNVQSVLTISIIQESKLWGVIVCSNMSSPTQLLYNIRQQCQSLGQELSKLISERVKIEEQEQLQLQSERIRIILNEISSTDNWMKSCLVQSTALLDAVNAAGAVIYFNKKLTFIGETPSEQQVSDLIKELRPLVNDSDIYVSEISHFMSSNFAGVASGVLALSLHKSSDDLIIWFRSEVNNIQGMSRKSVLWTNKDVQVCRTFKRYIMDEIIKEVIRSKQQERRGSGDERAMLKLQAC